MSVLENNYMIKMPNGQNWLVPVSFIANNRATYYASIDFDGDIGKSLKEDTLPLFDSDDYAIEDWAKNNMNWSDVVDVATRSSDDTCDYQDGWVNGSCNIVGL